MRAIVITKAGGPGVLQVVERPDPEPAPGEVRVRVAFAGLNFADVMARMGLYPDAPKLPCTVGYEVSGVIDRVGAGVDGLTEGDRVLALTRFGGQASVVCAAAGQVRRLPSAMSLEQGAALPVTYLTAFHMLHRVARVRRGARVLVHGAGGGVGVAAVQLLRREPDVVIFGTASASKHDFLRELGVHHPIDYRALDYATEVRRLTGGRGVDLILDPLGGPDWSKGYDLLAPAGHLCAFGFANMHAGATRSLGRVLSQIVRVPRWSPMKLMDDNKAVSGVNMGHLWGELELLQGEIDELLSLYDAGVIEPVIDSVFPFEQAAAAHERLESRKNAGKVLLKA
ncbi:MAG: zinc-binding dehydrogenase [Polyangiaceae bacterium]|nr:zinc-binding dehydrogenase [Polyangiaceae bacterium]